MPVRAQQLVRSTDGIRVQAMETPGACPVCGGAMRVKKTSRRHGTTLAHGRFVAHQTESVCAALCPGRYGTEALHESRAPQLRKALDDDGGWPLHVDATGEDGRGTLLVALAGWRRWVLGAWKIPPDRAGGGHLASPAGGSDALWAALRDRA
jgi:hypothetical protein